MKTTRSFPKSHYSVFILLFLTISIVYLPDAFAEVTSNTTPTMQTTSNAVISAPVTTSNLSTGPVTTTPAPRTGFSLLPYKPIYAIAAYDRTLDQGDRAYQNWEIQFQLSLKVAYRWTNAEVAFAYTQVSFWQAFNQTYSSPFRETNYAPEIMAVYTFDPGFLGLKKIQTMLSFIHESNGSGGEDSRSWNRVYGAVRLEWEDALLKGDQVFLELKPWYRIPESSKSSASDARGDDNPDITRYMGYGELTAGYRTDWGTLSTTVRNNLRASPNYGSLQFDITVPISKDVNFYIQVFNGYGLSLIDYNRYSKRVGFGVLVQKLPRLWW